MGYDAVVIGAGHNGLVAAAYLAQGGWKVGVLEGREVLGGCSSTEELWPGFRVSPAAYVISLFLPQIIDKLELRRHGLEILPRDPSSFTPLPDGRFLLLGHDGESNRESIAQFSERDADTYARYEAFLTNVAERLESLLLEPPPSLPPRLRETRTWWRYRRLLESLDSELPAIAELLTGAATPILTRWFESEPLRGALATDAIIGAFAAPSAPGTAYVLLHHVMGEAGGKRGVWGYVRGGMGTLAEALAGRCRELGVEIRTGARVARIETDPSGVTGVRLDSGETIATPRVASSIDAHHTYLQLVEPDRLPSAFLSQIRSLDYSSASAKINLALDALPDFETGSVPREIALRGTIHIAPNLEYIERAYDDAKYGHASQRPVLEITIPTTVDDTLAPPGKHLLSMFVQYVPYELADGEWTDARRDQLAKRCLNVIAEYAPNIRSIVRHTQVLTPIDLERIYGLKGGNIFQGAMHLHQLGPLRTPYRSPVDGLWLCGAATHPGGGVLGACGRNAALAMLKE
jgi:phytoene dehydrogenase-like protein